MNFKGTPAQEQAIMDARACLTAAHNMLAEADADLQAAFIARLPVKVGDVVLGGRNKLPAKIVGWYNAESGWARAVYKKRDGTWGNMEHTLFDWEIAK